ncbi:hypothetical protein [Desulfovibrio ferrophilus]|uniref:Dihydroorotate dehydrogenase n=1 Tax=Desulfovibrio ferrophilus TaxID=241368 RepID=A0A2Z6B241_9BACT|nr:hypothetical protein [Desulfovibrio ferrophilus]BBD09587.1 dihydroorotate dehydrogenase [Desulfovibrio ferrophilus]
MNEIQYEQLMPVYLFSIPRGGSNIFSAFMHNHDSIVALTHTAAKQYVDRMHLGQPLGLANSSCTYAESAPLKCNNSVTHVVLHNMHYNKKKKYYYIDYGLKEIASGRAQGVVLFRHPVSVFLSMDAFRAKFDRPGWRLSRENSYCIMERFILPQLSMLRNADVYPVEIGSFIKDIDAEYASLCKHLSLGYKPRYGSFQETFSSVCASDGNPYAVKDFSRYSGGFVEAKGYTPKPQPMFYNPATGQPLLGRGGFNPCVPVSHSRLTAFKHRLTPEAARILESVFTGYMARRDALWLLENEDLSIERLKAMDVNQDPMRKLFFVSLSMVKRVQKRFTACGVNKKDEPNV